MKAWEYFRKLLNDDSKFVVIRLQKKPIEVRGSEGGRYFLYPNGQVVDLDDRKPKLGRALRNELPNADLLSSLYIWITQKEAEFKKEWRCGNLDVFYRQNPRVTDNTIWEHERVREAFGHRESTFRTVMKYLPALIIIPVSIFAMTQVMSVFQEAATANTETGTTTFVEMIVNLMPCFLLFAFVVMMLSMIRRFGDL